MFRIEKFPRLLPVAVALAATACSGLFPATPQTGPAPLRPGATLAAEAFSGERAFAHLVALSELGPRPADSTANREALEYIRSRLEELDLEVIDLELGMRIARKKKDAAAKPGEEPPLLMARHLVARIRGESPDSIMLMAHYDTTADSPGANDGGSGPALLLELARQLAERPLPYNTEIVFLDREMATQEADPTTPLLQGSELLASHLQKTGTFDVVRLAVAFRQVGDHDLTIARDLHSNRIFREQFFEAAQELGHGAAFPDGRGYVEVASSHRPFARNGMPRVVSISDPWYGGEEPPGEYWGAGDTAEHCSAESLETVGVVTLAGLRRISEQLAKVDRISGRGERRRAEVMEAPEISGETVEEAAPVAGPGEAAAGEATQESGSGAEAPGAEAQAPQPSETPEAPAEAP